MKTKIIYISGNEIFDIAEIRAAFEEVRNALNLDKSTVLFGVPVDNEDTGLMPSDSQNTETEIAQTESVVVEEFVPEVEEGIQQADIKPAKKRGRKAKEIVEPIAEEETEDIQQETSEKVVPILSVLATKEENDSEPEEIEDPQDIEQEIPDSDIEIIPEISDDKQSETQETEDSQIDENDEEDEEEDLEKLLSAMTPLQEDALEEKAETIKEQEATPEDDISVDATLEQLANEFAENQDKIAAGTKSAGRNKIGKLRSFFPFKQSNHKDTGLGDLFGWAGIAANDEEFSVPGFFTNAAGKK